LRDSFPVEIIYHITSQQLSKGKSASPWYSGPLALYNLGSGSWLAWANYTAAHYVAIHCPRQQTTGPAMQPADTQVAMLGLHPVARKLLLISHPAEGRRLSWKEHAVG